MLQNPEMRKKAKYQLRPLVADLASSLRAASGSGRETSIVVGIVSVLTGYSFGVGKLELFGRSCAVPEGILAQVSQSVTDCRQRQLAVMVTKVTSPGDGQ
jgi:hypothetical protein